MENFKELKQENYGKKICLLLEGGSICFDPDSLKEVVGAENMSYDEYLDVQICSLGKYRPYFAMCYYNCPMGFKGQIERVTADHVCFKRISVVGMFPDGEMFDGKEEHVWMDKRGFESFQPGDCVSFFAEVYRYVKKGNGKSIDYSLRDPQEIEKIDPYPLPNDNELRHQAEDEIFCETCFLAEQCNKVVCLRKLENRKAW